MMNAIAGELSRLGWTVNGPRATQDIETINLTASCTEPSFGLRLDYRHHIYITVGDHVERPMVRVGTTLLSTFAGDVPQTAADVYAEPFASALEMIREKLGPPSALAEPAAADRAPVDAGEREGV